MTLEAEVDLQVLIRNGQLLRCHGRPLWIAYKALLNLYRWESPVITYYLLLVLNLMCLFLDTGYYLMGGLTLLVLVMFTGFCNDKNRTMRKLGVRRRNSSTQQILNQDQLMQELKHLLSATHTVVQQVNYVLDQFYSVILWEDQAASLRVYSYCGLVILGLNVLPLRYVFTLIVDAFLLGHYLQTYGWKVIDVLQMPHRPHYKTGRSGRWQCTDYTDREEPKTDDDDECDDWSSQGSVATSQSTQSVLYTATSSENDLTTSNSDSAPRCSPSSTDEEEVSASILGSVQPHPLVLQPEPEDPEPEPEELPIEPRQGKSELCLVRGDQKPSALTPTTECSKVNSQAEESVSAVREVASEHSPTSTDTAVGAATGRVGGVVGKLMEFRRRQQTTAGVCTLCNITFTTLFKRKRVCTGCGNNYCARCCFQKVPKSYLGVTAPEGQHELVLVCAPCYTNLTGSGGGQS